MCVHPIAEDDVRRLAIESVEHTFASEDEKMELRSILQRANHSSTLS